jgi:hypothetical protein
MAAGNQIPANVAAVAPAIGEWCDTYGAHALILAKVFIALALILALVETVITLWAKIEAARQGPASAATPAAKGLAAANVDPVKLIEALKNLLESLKALPAWIAIFLAGLALWWIAGQQPEACRGKDPVKQQQPDRPGDGAIPDNAQATTNKAG